jgi:hypothetical protein
VEPGKGYWFLSAQLSDFLLKGGSSVVINENNPFTMQLRATDWNMIGNPFPYPIDWQEVIDYNANHSTTIESLVTFENRAYNSSQLSLDKYEGALLYSSSNATLEIPLSAISNTSGRVALKQSRNQLKGYDTGDWEIGLNLSSDEMAYNVSGIGMKPDGSLGRDRYDWPMLPRLSTYLDLTFEDGITKNVVTSADAHTWDFQVNSNQQSITLSWEPLAIHHSNHRLLLLDLENQTIIDMAEETSYDFNLAVESKPFKIQYVPKQDMQEYLDFGESFIGAPSPNPFNEDLTIPISITSANAEVEVTIYNVLGKVVFQLEDMEMKKGYHKLSLTLSEEFLRSNHSGIYILNVFIRTIRGLKQVKKRIVFDK